MKYTTIQPGKKQTAGVLQAILIFALLFVSIFAFAFTIETAPVYFHLVLLFNGWLAWTFTEYCHHRFYSHAATARRRGGINALHQYHHHHPTQIKITLQQRAMLATFSAGMIFLSLRLNNYFTLLTGYFLGFTGYSFMHWFLHKERSARIFPVLHRFHIHHHCRHPDKCFGVSVTWWDFLFKTVPGEEDSISERILKFYYKR